MRVTFEHRHENKSCSACQDRVNERVKGVKVANVVKVKVFQVFQVFQRIPGSQGMSDFQTFFPGERQDEPGAEENVVKWWFIVGC